MLTGALAADVSSERRRSWEGQLGRGLACAFLASDTLIRKTVATAHLPHNVAHFVFYKLVKCVKLVRLALVKHLRWNHTDYAQRGCDSGIIAKIQRLDSSGLFTRRHTQVDKLSVDFPLVTCGAGTIFSLLTRPQWVVPRRERMMRKHKRDASASTVLYVMENKSRFKRRTDRIIHPY